MRVVKLYILDACRQVAVACSDGRVCFLSVTSGKLLGTCHAGGALKAAPAVDPWEGHVWVASHGCQVIVCKAPGSFTRRKLDAVLAFADAFNLRKARTSWRPGAVRNMQEGLLHFADGLWPLCAGSVIRQHKSPATVSTSVVFDAVRRRAYVACLDGSLLAFAVALHTAGHRHQAITLQWQLAGSAPILSQPALEPVNGLLLRAGVDGHIQAVSPAGMCLHRSKSRA